MKHGSINVVLLCSIATTYGYLSQKDSQNASSDSRPNILVIIADDLGWNDVGWKNSKVYTPNLDRLARQGVILENSYVQPLCTPACDQGYRPHADSSGIYDFWENDKIIYPPTGSYDTDLFTERAVQLINSHDKKSPFFLTLAHATPKYPLQVPQKYKDLYPDIMDDNRKTYLGMVSSLDDSVGKVVTSLKQTGQMDNTVIVFFSDNGGDVNYGASNDPLRGNKGSLWEGGVKSTGFVYGPKYLPLSGCKHRGLVHVVDWYDTILDIAGHSKERPSELDSSSQWPYIRKCQGSARNEFIYNIDDVTNTEAIRVGKFKLIKGDPRVFIEAFPSLAHVDPNNTDVRLYNIKVDPNEQNDLAKKRPKTVKRLLRRLSLYRRFGVPSQNQTYLPSNVTAPNGVLQLGWC